jgi:hypothetical protein
MSRRRALTDEQAVEAERWFSDYERVGTIASKAQELGVDDETLLDAIKRVRGEISRPMRRKLDIDAEVDRILSDIPRGTEVG